MKILLTALAMAGLASASLVSQTGNFAADDDVVQIPFAVLVGGDYVVSTSGYAAGGFDPIVTLFDAGGNFIDDDDDGGVDFDSRLVLALAPGNYTLAVTQFDNFANGSTLGLGFARQGQPAFTATYGCANGQFCDVDANDRSSYWAVNVSAVPEPSTFGLAAVALLGAVFRRRR